MPTQDDIADSRSAAADTNAANSPIRLISWTAVSLTTLLLVAVAPVLAQSGQTNVVCQAEGLSTAISGFFQFTTGLGVVGMVVIWQGNSLMEMFSFGLEAREKIKRHKRSAFKSTTMLLVLGPLYTVGGSMMGLPLASCVDLAPW